MRSSRSNNLNSPSCGPRKTLVNGAIIILLVNLRYGIRHHVSFPVRSPYLVMTWEISPKNSVFLDDSIRSSMFRSCCCCSSCVPFEMKERLTSIIFDEHFDSIVRSQCTEYAELHNQDYSEVHDERQEVASSRRSRASLRRKIVRIASDEGYINARSSGKVFFSTHCRAKLN